MSFFCNFDLKYIVCFQKLSAADWKGAISNPYSFRTYIRFLMPLQPTTFESSKAEGEIAHNEQCFLLYYIQ